MAQCSVTCKQVVVSLAGLTLAAGLAVAQTPGPDVIVGELHNLSSYGGVTVNGTPYSAFAIGTTSCNRGTTTLDWYDDSNQTPGIPTSWWNRHPVIGQNLYRFKVVNGAGQFEQIGQSWLKHGFTALQGNACTLGCSPYMNGDELGVGCSDPYGASLNGSQGAGDLGPKSQVNPATGVYPFPVQYNGNMTIANLLSRRIIAKNADIDPAQNTGALYYIEGQYVAWDDAQYVNGPAEALPGLTDNDDNNASHRRVQFFWNTAPNPDRWEMQFISGQGTQRERGAIYAWSSAEAGVTVNPFDVAGDGRYVIGYKVTPIAGGMYHYEYMIFNINSDRAGHALKINFPAGGRASSVAPTNIGFHDCDYHSGEVYDNTDWVATNDATGIVWSGTQDHGENVNANALRWSTAYSFRFDSPRPPVAGTATLTLFKPGTPSSVDIPTLVPEPAPCDLDFNNDTLFPDTADINDLLHVFAGGACPTPSCDSIDFNSDGLFPDTADIDDFLAVFGGAPCV